MCDKRGMDVPTFSDGVAASSSHFCARWSPCSAELIAELRVAPKLICTDHTTRQATSFLHAAQQTGVIAGQWCTNGSFHHNIGYCDSLRMDDAQAQATQKRPQAADQRFGGGRSLHAWSDVRM